MHFEDYLTGYEFSYSAPLNESYISDKPILTIIVDVFYNLPLVRESIGSVLSQTYPNVELIIVDNGAYPEVKEYIHSVYQNSKNVALITFSKNVFAWDDVTLNVVVCWNAALKYAKGKYISHLSYDDMFSDNYAARMVQLFTENSNCCTAAPLAKIIDANGNVIGDTAAFNMRSKYTLGEVIAKNMISDDKDRMFTSPGEICMFRTDSLRNAGGFDRIVDFSQVLKFSIEGENGFDKEAFVYWRNHTNQLNKLATKSGSTFFKSELRGWNESGIIEIWRAKFGKDKAKAIELFRDRLLKNGILSVVKINASHFLIKAVLFNIASVMRNCPQYLHLVLFVIIREFIYLPIFAIPRIPRLIRRQFQKQTHVK
jgi:glycosyltransferase involved in cell wall biosynthesis